MAMNGRANPLSGITPRAGHRLCAAGIFLLGLAASLVVAAVPAKAAPALAAVQPAAHAAIPATATPRLNAPSLSTFARMGRRVFVESTTVPSLEGLKSARLQVLVKPYAPQPGASAAPRSAPSTGSNRQRAP